jgi:hypothetical protein
MSNRNNRNLSRAQKWTACSALFLAAGSARAGAVFWGDTGDSNSTGITPSMFLRNDNVAAVDQFLATQPIKALKIDTNISPANLSAIYNKYNINYTFLDYESASATTTIANVVNQIKASTATGPAFMANQSYVSNFAFAPVYSDPTAVGSVPKNADYVAAGLNMASENLYPGSPGFRSPTTGTSTAPNIRSSLFTMPIIRASQVTASMPTGQVHVPYVDRFNNWQNSTLDTDGDPSNGYRFVTQNQLLSRGDFQAQILHYRLRGATSVHGLQGGVEGYTPEQFKADINTGWSSVAVVNDIFSDPNARLATLDTQATVDGVLRSLEETGVVYSGAYSSAKGKLVLLLSNLDDQSHVLSFASRLGGKAVPGDFPVDAGTHEILQFNANGSNWDFAGETPVFADDNRAGAGVPEPTTLGLSTMLLLAATATRRSRNRKQ